MSKKTKTEETKTDDNYIQYKIYQNLQVYCAEYVKHDIQDNILEKEDFMKNLYFDKNVHFKTKHNNEDWSIYIVSADTKLLANILTKNLNNIIIVYPPEEKKNVYRIIDKHSRTNVSAYNYNVFKIILPKKDSSAIYRILSPKEVSNICKSFRTNKRDFVEISSIDPMSIWYGVKRGDLIEITVTSEISGKCLYYRYCTS